MEVEAHFLAKEDGIVAGIALAEMVFGEVDLPEGRADSIVVAERVVLSFMQRMSGIATLTKVNEWNSDFNQGDSFGTPYTNRQQPCFIFPSLIFGGNESTNTCKELYR
ncbi:nicotinate-nucleotide pyrophosphorylase [carboxylating], chloroplastic-like [Olea europaea subsp. europaea]|uniref:Nicotinate-nucleotide pyrophosphorylase [carboxylating], chloroplastic-like n=1 Tax=Olea europaea subsp. europaea TaxID=158383 RepID=A0A8S0V1H8_OLEEU|nr:nicotinate-nucleotide pyrophosphorylase [carboxylating], chloroplastic-like [Olea europaea subsp. europaea]